MEKNSLYILPNISFYIPQIEKNIMQVWNDMRVSKWWQNRHFWMKYSFNLIDYEICSCILFSLDDSTVHCTLTWVTGFQWDTHLIYLLESQLFQIPPHWWWCRHKLLDLSSSGAWKSAACLLPQSHPLVELHLSCVNNEIWFNPSIKNRHCIQLNL